MKVKFQCDRVLENTEPKPVCFVHGDVVQPGKTYITAANALIVCEQCLKHMNTCQKLFQGTRSVVLEKNVEQCR